MLVPSFFFLKLYLYIKNTYIHTYILKFSLGYGSIRGHVEYECGQITIKRNKNIVWRCDNRIFNE